MSKRSTKKLPQRAGATSELNEADLQGVGQREPCPCGSGRRFKACHGRSVQPDASDRRAFAGFVSECDLVALRELVPSATATLPLRANSDRQVTLATVLPLAWPAVVRADGDVLLGLQVTTGTGDVSRDLGSALARALESEPGKPVPPARDSSDAPRLQELVVAEKPLDITVHQDFEFWLQAAEQTEDVRASLERANAYAHPTQRLAGVTAAYWTQMGEKEHLRWVMPEPEEDLLNALARLHAAEESSLGEGTRLVGMFRALGVVAPVWDLPLGFGAGACEQPAVDFGARLQEALADDSPLSDAQRRARAGLTTRQVTLR